MAIASIQRYMFIYHRNLINTPLKYYVPVVVSITLLFIWYIVLIFFYPCEQQLDSTQLWCWGACYVYQGIIGTIDWIISSLVPVLLTTIFSLILIVRVIHQKYKMRGGRTWRTTRKLTIQLLTISFLFLAIYLPLIIFGLIRIWFDPYFLLLFTMDYYAYTVYLVPLLIPFVCLISLPEVVKELTKLCCFKNRVQPFQGNQFTMTAISRRNPQSIDLRRTKQ